MQVGGRRALASSPSAGVPAVYLGVPAVAGLVDATWVADTGLPAVGACDDAGSGYLGAAAAGGCGAGGAAEVGAAEVGAAGRWSAGSSEMSFRRGSLASASLTGGVLGSSTHCAQAK
jgi:hypothetical protein